MWCFLCCSTSEVDRKGDEKAVDEEIGLRASFEFQLFEIFKMLLPTIVTRGISILSTLSIIVTLVFGCEMFRNCTFGCDPKSDVMTTSR